MDVLSLLMAVFFFTAVVSVGNSYRRSSGQRGKPQPPPYSFVPPLIVTAIALLGALVLIFLWGTEPALRHVLMPSFGTLAVVAAIAAAVLIRYDPYARRQPKKR